MTPFLIIVSPPLSLQNSLKESLVGVYQICGMLIQKKTPKKKRKRGVVRETTRRKFGA